MLQNVLAPFSWQRQLVQNKPLRVRPSVPGGEERGFHGLLNDWFAGLYIALRTVLNIVRGNMFKGHSSATLDHKDPSLA